MNKKMKIEKFPIVGVLCFISCIIGSLVGVLSHELISPPSPGVLDTSSLPPQSTPDYYPSYEEMQLWCGAEVDGIWGPESDRLYRAKRAEQYCNEMALKLWPEDE